MSELRYNDLRSSLGGALTNSGTTITFPAALTHSNGTAVPTISGGNYIALSIVDPDSGALVEIVHLTAYTAGATTGTIARGQQGTTGVAHAAGAAVINAPTVADFGEAWVAFPYAANWADLGSGWQASRYRRIGNIVRVELASARSSSGSGTDATIGTLPSGFRPAATQALAYGGVTGGVNIANLVYVTSGGLVKTSANIASGGAVSAFGEVTLD